ncbi:enoyl-CoA hydratase/isomerase family protein [Rhodocytophaga rosea]|uniref:Enoyl-CoA hydratase/isomerase family protein n=1 Tax=Rhodocytophaga rosea TaxID=2704465 RepID=A0A6C0GTA9_9BACT|nr:enoyl-CoA hydratase-related protein [Rhodocytophaga rosea]QHT71044.1 enoyl-CoA hydratase/isomerase family protein [Rhodocytophaga rosea]
MNLISHFPTLLSLKENIRSLFNPFKVITNKKSASDLTTDFSKDAADSRLNLSTGSPTLLACRKNHTLTLILNRPEVLNAINIEMADALLEQLKKAAADPAVRVIVLTGNGRAFCSGGDLKFALEANPLQPGNSFQALTSILHECIEVIRIMAKPVIASINGPAAGAGLFLSLACDIRIMSQTAYLKVSNPTYGLSLPAGGTFTLPRLIGLGKALELIIIDQPVTANAAHTIGLISYVADNTSLSYQTELLAEELALKAIHTIGQVKKLLNESFIHTLTEQLLAEQQAIIQSANHAEGREGLAAFVEKRTPDYVKKHV